MTIRWTPRSLSGGQHEGTCADHPKRASVFVWQDGHWIDTGLCATDMRRVERAERMAAAALRRGPPR